MKIKTMKKSIFLATLMALMGLQTSAQNVSVSKALFKQGDDMSWAKLDVDDASWSEIDITTQWDKQGFPQNNMAYAWYRIHVNIPRSLLKGADQQNVVLFNLPKADDVDECYLNGKLIGSTGRMPTDPAGYLCGVDIVRNYVVDVRTGGIRWDAENVIAVRVYNRGGSGGCWGTNLHESRLTPDEQYTHITLWTLLASNMLIGCDIAQMDEFTLNLLCNNEVNAINQDMLGQQADRVQKEGDIEVWSRPLSDGAIGVGIFNVGDKDLQVDMKALCPLPSALSTQPNYRDLWRQKDLSEGELNCTIPAHGCRYLKVRGK